jgi:hypothetical protein
MSRLVPLVLLLTLWTARPPLQRLNGNCDWTNDAPQTLDLRKPADARHLENDALLAEELAIRYADVKRGRRSGHFVGNDQYVETRKQCLTSLISVIGSTHGIRPQGVRQFVGRRRLDFDFVALLSFAVLYAVACGAFVRLLIVRFPPDEFLPAFAAVGFASAMTSGAGLMTFGLWAAGLDMMRIADLHMSYRADRSPWSEHQLALFVGAVALFTAIALFHYVRASRAETPTVRFV